MFTLLLFLSVFFAPFSLCLFCHPARTLTPRARSSFLSKTVLLLVAPFLAATTIAVSPVWQPHSMLVVDLFVSPSARLFVFLC